jgi:hypothetical protein
VTEEKIMKNKPLVYPNKCKEKKSLHTITHENQLMPLAEKFELKNYKRRGQ